MENAPTQTFGLPWYAAEDYSTIRSMMDDCDSLPPTHAKWQMAARTIEIRLLGEGHHVVRVELKPDSFREFCASKHLGFNADSRRKFAALGAAREPRIIE